jgi:tetratricopeptide (TPR) repeat protein
VFSMAKTKVCPYCFETIKRKAIRCKHCHADLTSSASTTTAQSGTVGATGGVTIGGAKHHIEGGIHIVNKLGELESVDEATKRELIALYENQTQKSPKKAKYHFALGLSFLDLGIYDRAIDSLETALDRGPREADILYYLALAHVGGKRPKILRLSEVQTIEEYLRAAIQLDSGQAHFLYLWALIKYDYYIANGLRSSSPTIEELLTVAQQGTFIQAEIQQMFNHIQIPDSPITEIILDRW